MKTRTFGVGTYDVFRLVPDQWALRGLYKTAVSSYIEHRANGVEGDSPSNEMPEDGRPEWVRETEVANYLDKPARTDYWRARYTEGPGDDDWMKQRDRNYLTRIATEKLAGKTLSAQEQEDLAISLGQEIFFSLQQQHQAEAERKANQPPEDFLCPISMELMLEPVMAEDGYSYDRAPITDWLQQHQTSPKTGAVLESKKLNANWQLKAAIHAWVKQHPQLSDDDFLALFKEDVTLEDIQRGLFLNGNILIHPMIYQVISKIGSSPMGDHAIFDYAI